MSTRRSQVTTMTVVVTMMLAAVLSVHVGQADASGDAADMHAFLDGRPIPLADVSKYHCHDRDLPIIRCFYSAEARNDDLDAAASRAEMSVLDSVAYVTFYEDDNYHGATYTASNPITNLGTIGWNDIITSFKSLNGGRPRFYSDAGYGPPSWRWAAGAWVANVGSSANDLFSSVKNDP